jgi:hypothetical protein
MEEVWKMFAQPRISRTLGGSNVATEIHYKSSPGIRLNERRTIHFNTLDSLW